MRRSYLSRKAQGYVEYLGVAAIIIAITLISFPPLFLTASNEVVNNSPEVKNNDVYKDAQVLGTYSGAFTSEFTKLEEDPAAATCVDEVKSIMSTIATIDAGNSANLSSTALAEVVSAFGDANLAGNYHITAASLLSPACKSLTTVDKVEDILTNEVINLDLMQDTCEDVCTITTTANAVVREIGSLINDGTIPANIITSHNDSPVSSISGSIENTFKQYYYVGPDTVNPYTNYKNMINLIEYASQNSQLNSELAAVYEKLKVKVEEAMMLTLESPSYYTTMNHPGWESIPVRLDGGSSTYYSPPSSSGGGSSTPIVASFYFCGEPGDLSEFLQ
ncbi:MAG: hypothetical protein A2287_06000 [Candidatus Melainabacteria bacterium RIFOXYA12_FULL_32_12]|nr:MAG: hypothetical protein A2255_04410 [Candidatus Melainabacteria bacterium RIFOXYA2_FULL_32_9]OGI27370.1 MAG: hypothetical protein A2287_06000 [Candidatus Melainabacteria bacterium RIFOXYA12_FULL_32_12]